MKSMLHEAPSIIKAIEKAWDESGKPAEFTIKILESGEKGILWFSKHPAIISITYDPKKQQSVRKSSQKKLRKTYPKKEKPVYEKPKQQKQYTQSKQKRYVTQAKQEQPKQQSNPAPAAIWTQEYMDNITTWLKELVGILNITQRFNIKSDKKTLHITFDKKLFNSTENDKVFFISLSYMLMQFIKRKYKKKFKGFHLVIKSKESASNDASKSSTPK